jgi:trans-L-3-hydroxyproline dehydratase
MLENWTPPENWNIITTLETHAMGEPLRIFTSGLPEIKGATILEKRLYFRDNYDFIRTGTMWEPRGHADMYGVVITEPTTPESDIGAIFLHNEGYSTMCGHAIIAISKALLDTGWIKKEGDTPVITIDTPAGKIIAEAHRVNGTVQNVSFRNVPSFLYSRDLTIDVPEIGKVTYDIAFGGAFYAFCQANELNISLDEKEHDRLVDTGRRIKNTIMENIKINHPFEEDLGFLYGTIIIGPAKNESHHSRNVCIFADGEIDRSPTGTGVSARAAIHFAKNELPLGESITIESILGTCMSVKAVKTVEYGGYEAIIPEVTGTASITGQCRLYFDPDDPLKHGFIMR